MQHRLQGQTMGGAVGPVEGGLFGSGSRVGAGWFVGWGGGGGGGTGGWVSKTLTAISSARAAIAMTHANDSSELHRLAD